MHKQRKHLLITLYILLLFRAEIANALDRTSSNAIILLVSDTTISGTTTNGDSISRVELIIQNSSSQYWNESGFGEYGKVVASLQNDTLWQYQFYPKLPPDVYTVIAFPFDDENNISVNWDSASFTVLPPDNEPPTASVTSANDSVLTGIAHDNVLVDRVELAISNSNSEYWNGTSFGSYERVWAFLKSDGAWHYQFSPLLPPDDYTFVVFPFDSSENTPTIEDGFSFTVEPPDTEPPNAVIDTANSTLLTGHATDNIQINRIELAIQNSSDQYWNGASFGSYKRVEAILGNNDQWRYPFSPALSPDEYKVHVYPFDNSENTPEAQNIFSFTVLPPDLEPPTARISGAYNSVLTGIAKDNVQVNRVEIAIRNADNQYWNGSSFGDYQRVQASMKNGGVWLYTFSPLLPTGEYNATAFPYDSSENTPPKPDSVSFSVSAAKVDSVSANISKTRTSLMTRNSIDNPTVDQPFAE